MVSKVLLHSPVMKSTVGTMFTSWIASWWGHPGHIIDITRFYKLAPTLLLGTLAGHKKAGVTYVRTERYTSRVKSGYILPRNSRSL